MTHPMDVGLTDLQAYRNKKARAYIERQVANERRKAVSEAVARFYEQPGMDERAGDRRHETKS